MAPTTKLWRFANLEGDVSRSEPFDQRMETMRLARSAPRPQSGPAYNKERLAALGRMVYPIGCFRNHAMPVVANHRLVVCAAR